MKSASFMGFGYNVSQLVRYISKFSKRDKVLTRVWVLLVMGFNAVSSISRNVQGPIFVRLKRYQSNQRTTSLKGSVLYGGVYAVSKFASAGLASISCYSLDQIGFGFRT